MIEFILSAKPLSAVVPGQKLNRLEKLGDSHTLILPLVHTTCVNCTLAVVWNVVKAVREGVFTLGDVRAFSELTSKIPSLDAMLKI